MSVYVIYSWSVTVQGHFSVLVWLLRGGITDGTHWQNHCSTLYHRTLPLPQSISFPPSHWYCHVYCPIPACISALFIHSLQSTHNEPPVIILRVAVLSLFSIQFIGIYLRLINRGFHLRYVSILFFYLKMDVPQFCSQDTSHVFIQLHWVIPLRALLQNFRYI